MHTSFGFGSLYAKPVGGNTMALFSDGNGGLIPGQPGHSSASGGSVPGGPVNINTGWEAIITLPTTSSGVFSGTDLGSGDVIITTSSYTYNMSSMVCWLDGQRISSLSISAKKHKFVGMMRQPILTWGSAIVCPCGTSLTTKKMAQEHKKEGHEDAMLFQTIPPVQPRRHRRQKNKLERAENRSIILE